MLIITTITVKSICQPPKYKCWRTWPREKKSWRTCQKTKKLKIKFKMNRNKSNLPCPLLFTFSTTPPHLASYLSVPLSETVKLRFQVFFPIKITLSCFRSHTSYPITRNFYPLSLYLTHCHNPHAFFSF